MTMTVKLEPLLEEQVRQRAASTGRNASEVIRAALESYLAQPEKAPARSPHDLGADLFGRYRGTATLAEQRKQALAEVWNDKHRQRAG